MTRLFVFVSLSLVALLSCVSGNVMLIVGDVEKSTARILYECDPTEYCGPTDVFVMSRHGREQVVHADLRPTPHVLKLNGLRKDTDYVVHFGKCSARMLNEGIFLYS